MNTSESRKPRLRRARNTPLSGFSEGLLQLDAIRPDELFYAADLLGSTFRDEDVHRLDAPYDELARTGLMEKTGDEISFFGARKTLHRITHRGSERVRRGSSV